MQNRIILPLVLLTLLAVACEDNPDRHLKLGNWYYERGLVDDAILEYREVIRLYPSNPGELTREELNSVMKAHYNLSIAYSKKGWYEFALKEAEKTFDMWPTKENYEMVELLKKRRSLERLDIESGS
ncbi:MAG: tetratricopeptide repeat protein [Fidelibacterota bacterium]